MKKSNLPHRKNNYSFYLAKKVNDDFTVIWQSKGPVATVDSPSYQYKNTFDITTPSFIVNFTNDPVRVDDLTFSSGGGDLAIGTGQTTTLQDTGILTPAKNGGKALDILINNELQGNPHEILLDSNGNYLWVNRLSGMNIGTATLTSKNEYQLWFGNIQETGTLIATNLSSAYVATLQDGGSIVLTYNNNGKWVTGEPAERLSAAEVKALHARGGIKDAA